MPVLWSMELDPVSLKAMQCPVGFVWGVYRFSMALGSPLSFGSDRHIYFHSHVKIAPQHILTVASPLHLPGVFPRASTPWSHPMLQAIAC